MEDMFYEGLKDGGTFRLDDTTKGKLNGNPNNILGKVVAFVKSKPTGEPTVGYGASGNVIAGVVTAIEPENENSENYVVTVSWNNTFDKIVTASTSTTAAEGVGVAVDGAGGVITSPTTTNAFCLALHEGKTSCLIRVL